MSSHTMSFALPPEMRAYIDERVRSGRYGNTSEYLRDLIRRDREHQAALELGNLIANGVASGEGRLLTDEVVAELRERAFSTTR